MSIFQEEATHTITHKAKLIYVVLKNSKPCITLRIYVHVSSRSNCCASGRGFMEGRSNLGEMLQFVFGTLPFTACIPRLSPLLEDLKAHIVAFPVLGGT
jgi:hypothetical protein